ncbi:hypothetical protein MHUMG1_00173 [Metarhizium humberi]|uniref:Uncharacterized protein n=1 Tax=Metarhizium humberi TaxID=2596975 RepID=A0A9P8MMS4_9HYPO|nr:hypothetical protein MHUMG1_00173 [Metarhizium humberi]
MSAPGARQAAPPSAGALTTRPDCPTARPPGSPGRPLGQVDQTPSCRQPEPPTPVKFLHVVSHRILGRLRSIAIDGPATSIL